MSTTLTRAAWVEVDLAALRHNVKEIINRVGPDCQLMGVIKANGYGHGATATATALGNCGVSRFAVATIQEALHLRNAGCQKPITILSPCPPEAAYLLVEQHFQPLISSLEDAKALSKAASKADRQVEIFIPIDTGMCRLGLDPAEKSSVDLVKKMAAVPNITVLGLFSHFSSADEASPDFTQQQHRRLLYFRDSLKAQGVTVGSLCIANSGAIMNYPETWHEIVRPGIILYGLYPSNDIPHDSLDLWPAMQVKAKITRLRWVKENTAVGYGRKWHSPGKSLIATAPVGYADGFPRILSSKTRVLVHGTSVPQVGNICMDQFMFDVTKVPDVKEGDVVTLLGIDGDEKIPAEELAQLAGTINYEIVCNFGQRLPVVYK